MVQGLSPPDLRKFLFNSSFMSIGWKWCKVTRCCFCPVACPLALYSINTHINASTTDSFLKNIVGKEEIARSEQFLLFPHCFLLDQKIAPPFVNIYDIISLFVAEFEEPKIGMCGKG